MRQKRRGRGEDEKPRKRPSTGSKRRFSSGGFWSSPWSSLLVFLVALGLRLIHLHQMSRYAHYEIPVLDAAYFDDWGRRIAAGDWFGHEVFFVDPLYPYFLGVLYKVFGHNLDTIRLVQAVIGAGGAVLIQRLGILLLGGPAGLVCGLAAAGYRPFIFYDGLLLKAVLKVPLVTLFLIGAVQVLENARLRWALVTGLALGLAVLVRGNMLAMIPVTALIFLFSGKLKPPPRLVAAVLLVAGCATVLGPVAWRNHDVGGGWVLSASSLGQNLYIGNHPGNTSGAYVGPPFTRPNPEYEENDFKAEAERRIGHRLDSAQVSGFWTRETLKLLSENPWRLIGLAGRKLWLVTHAVEVPDNYSFDFESKHSWILRLPFPGFAVLFPLGLVGILAALRDKKRTGLRFLSLFVIVYTLTLLPFFITSRFRIPVVPALLILAPFGVMATLAAFREREMGRGAIYIGLIVVASFYTRQTPGWIPTAEIDFNVATELKEKGRLTDAEQLFREAIQTNPQYAEAYNNLGAVLAAEGRPDEAREMFARASALKPDYWEAQYNRADQMVREGDFEGARPLLEALVARKPDSYEATLLLGLVNRRIGQTDRALALYLKAESLKPQAVEAPFNRAVLLKDLGRVDEARAVLERLAREHPDHEPTQRLLKVLGSPP